MIIFMVAVLAEGEVEAEMMEFMKDLTVINVVERAIIKISATTFMDILLKQLISLLRE